MDGKFFGSLRTVWWSVLWSVTRNFESPGEDEQREKENSRFYFYFFENFNRMYLINCSAHQTKLLPFAPLLSSSTTFLPNFPNPENYDSTSSTKPQKQIETRIQLTEFECLSTKSGEIEANSQFKNGVLMIESKVFRSLRTVWCRISRKFESPGEWGGERERDSRISLSYDDLI